MEEESTEQRWRRLYQRFLRQKRSFYPAYHLAPPGGWMNDPNGLIYYRGLYHAFYQYYPDKPEWGPMHWGHATSADMLRWRHYPPALYPTEGADKDGCFSGSAVEHEGKLCLIYTGHCWLGEAGENGLRPFREAQCLAVSEDGFHFAKKGEVLAPPPGITHFRDPKVWFEDGEWRLVLGVSDSKDQGQVYLYHGKSLSDWEFDRVLAGPEEGMGYMWECPDFFPLGEKRVLSFSPQGIQAARGYERRNLYQCGYVMGAWQPGGDFAAETQFAELDGGHDYYAAQSFAAADGRRIMMAWLDMWESPQPSAAEGWTGAMTLPRALSLDAEGRLRIRPVAELESLRGAEQKLGRTELDNQAVRLAENVTAHEFVLEWERAAAKAERYGLRLGRCLMICWDTQSGRLALERFFPDLGLSSCRSVALAAADTLSLRIFFDYSSVEVFANDGEAVLTSRIYPAAAERVAYLFADGGKAALSRGSHWELKACAPQTEPKAADWPEQSE